MTGTVAAESGESPCLVIAHRGASGYMPEHTLAAYRLAILLGADYIEPDLVMTRDGHFVARHENKLDGTTDIESRPEFADRRATRELGDRELSGWFSEDFSLAEIKRLRARERLPEVRPANQNLDGLFDIPTLEEVIALVRTMEQTVGRRIGIYPELKEPGYFRTRGFDPEGALVQILKDSGYSKAEDPVFIQSFEADSLKRLDKLTDLRLVFLLSRDKDAPEIADGFTSDDGLRQLAQYVDGIGVEKYGLIIPKDEAGNLQLNQVTDLVPRAKRAGLVVHAWTFRAENEFLPVNFQGAGPATALGDSRGEHVAFIQAGVSGLFTEQPDIARAACRDVASVN